MTEKTEENIYYCCNCTHKTTELYKKYSPTVLKLSECENCDEVADKYVEYDLIIIIIDLVLLNPKAYRHILLNTSFKNFWKLSVILILVESFCSWSLANNTHNSSGHNKSYKETKPSLPNFDMNIDDLKFYAFLMNVALSYLGFVLSVYGFTVLYYAWCKTNVLTVVSFTLITKTITLSSAGAFLQLPSLIWDVSLYNYHLHFITLYTCLSQLLAYKVIFGHPKMWCLFVLFSSQLLKYAISSHLSVAFSTFFSK